MKKRSVFIVVLLVIILIFGVVSYFKSSSTVQIEFDPRISGLVVDIYKTSYDANNDMIQWQKPVAKNIAGSKSLRLKKEGYRIVSQKNDRYEQVSIDFNPTTNNKIIISPSLNRNTLDSMLKNDIQSIRNSINSKYPQINTLYTINEGKLYQFGEWYATTLTSKSDDKKLNDTLRLIMNKNSGHWELVTQPPSLIISSVNYPTVPKDIIDDINNL